MLKKSFLILFILLFFTACSIKEQIVAEFYLEQKNYIAGSKHFLEKIKKNPNDAKSQYYYGRFLLANKNYKKSLLHFKKAVLLDNTSSIHYSWLGISYSYNKNKKKEKESYLKALILDNKNIQALLYLAHNLYDSKDYKNSLIYYKQVLVIEEYNMSALYNRALALNKLKRLAEEKNAWLVYLSAYPSQYLSSYAVDFLNKLGNYTYKNLIINKHKIVMKEIKFEYFKDKIASSSYSSLNLLAKKLTQNNTLHIIVFQKNNSLFAKEKAKSIKKYILNTNEKINANKIKLSWFNKEKIIKVKNKKYFFNEYVEFIVIRK